MTTDRLVSAAACGGRYDKPISGVLHHHRGHDQRLISAEQDPQGVMVMNIHKSKGKEFDGVIVVEGAFKSFFFDRTEKKPHPHSRRLLRVAITRARIYAALVRPDNASPLYDP